MPRINVSRVLGNPKFAQPFKVYRKSGGWIAGRFEQTETEITIYGTVSPLNPRDLLQVPEGDRVTGAMNFHATQELFTTNGTGTSDEIEWRGERYRIYSVVPYADYGYRKASGVRMVST